MKGLKELPHATGIYKITNLINNKCYIGQAKDIYRRCNEEHIYGCNNSATASFHIYQAFAKYGLENFSVEVIELCDQSILNEREIYWIKYYNSFYNGYNMTEGGSYFSPKVHAPETEEKRQKTRELNHSLQSENHPRAKLTNEEVWNIRERYKQGESISKIYQDYCNIYQDIGTFQRIVLGATYTSVGNIPTKEEKSKQHSNRKFDSQQIIDIRKAYYEQNITQIKLAEQYNVSQSVIKDIVNYKTYQEVKADIEDKRIRKRYRFTDDEVRTIRKRAEKGETPMALANEYHVDSSVIYNCIKRKTYKNVQ